MQKHKPSEIETIGRDSVIYALFASTTKLRRAVFDIYDYARPNFLKARIHPPNTKYITYYIVVGS